MQIVPAISNFFLHRQVRALFHHVLSLLIVRSRLCPIGRFGRGQNGREGRFTSITCNTEGSATPWVGALLQWSAVVADEPSHQAIPTSNAAGFNCPTVGSRSYFPQYANLVREALFWGLVFRFLEQAKTERNKLVLSSSIIHACTVPTSLSLGGNSTNGIQLRLESLDGGPKQKQSPVVGCATTSWWGPRWFLRGKTAITAIPEFSCPGPNFHNVMGFVVFWGVPSFKMSKNVGELHMPVGCIRHSPENVGGEKVNLTRKSACKKKSLAFF